MNILPETFYQWLTWIVSGFGVYLFREVLDVKSRTQRLEDLQGSKVDVLSKKLDELELRMGVFEQRLTDIEKTLIEIKFNVHAQKNAENNIYTALSAILKRLDNEVRD